HGNEPRFSIEYFLNNQCDEELPFLLKIHPALAIEEGDEVLLPECSAEAVDLGFSQIIGKPGKTKFPTAIDANGRRVHLNRALTRESRLREFFYCSDLASGECGVKNQRTGSMLRFEFDRKQFPYVWVFQSFGGFNGHYVMMLEPCTTLPYDLMEACRR